MSDTEIRDFVSTARFKFQFMTLMMTCCREKEASKSYEEGMELLSKILENLDHKIEKSIADNS